MDSIKEAERTEYKELQELYQKFIKEKKQYFEEMRLLNQKILSERKRLKDEEIFFAKKMEILKGGYAQLEADKKQLEQERIALENGRQKGAFSSDEPAVRMLFRGVTNPLTLKKRYKDLIKIFHPDNICGDTDMIQMINQVYDKMQEEVSWQRKA